MKNFRKIRQLIEKYGYIDGSHHKQWLIDQILRLTFNNMEEYEDWLGDYYNETESSWDTGIAP